LKKAHGQIVKNSFSVNNIFFVKISAFWRVRTSPDFERQTGDEALHGDVDHETHRHDQDRPWNAGRIQVWMLHDFSCMMPYLKIIRFTKFLKKLSQLKNLKKIFRLIHLGSYAKIFVRPCKPH
jgi:hypothetical protein